MAEADRGAARTAPRARVEAALDRVVRDNRVTLAVTVPAVGAALLLAASRGLVPAEVALAPPLLLAAVLAMRLPLVAGLLPTIRRRAVVGLLAVGLFAYAVEYVGVTTGVPYGAFGYTTDFGPSIGGAVPVALPLLYVPLVLDAYLLGLALLDGRTRSRVARVGVGVGLLLAVDLVLDPGAVAVGFWAYDAGGPYYGVPVSNLAGWVLSGSVAVLLVDLALDRDAIERRFAASPYVLDDLVSFLVLWGGVNLAVGNWVAVLVAAGLAVAVGSVQRVPLVSGRAVAALRAAR